ncbi:ParB/RepB/Spo0J family partition protein [Galactobacter valiniphilus]|uniref:ParB/RepB/Spo0J family partition protein n=1 Tax=Galactobacter valiniphilus TaxID=2676122 RepID=UPI00373676B9
MSTFENLNPASLIVKVQVRTDAAADKALVADVKANGIIQPLTGYRNEAGGVVILAGHRRTLAAMEAGLDTVPVYVHEAAPSEADRIVAQVSENTRREELSEADQAAALFDLTQHVSDAQAAKRLHVSRKHVDTVKAVMASETASAHFQESMNLEEASVLAEFDGDAEAVERITSRQPWQSLAQVAETIRQERAGAAALAAATAEHEKAGRAVILDGSEVNGQYGALEAALPVRVTTVNRPDGTEATEEDANAVYLATTWQGEVKETLLISGWHEAGYTDKHGAAAVLPPTTEEEEAAAAEAKEARRKVIANNKAMDAANVVRREWVATFLTRKTLPKDAAMFVARALTQGNTSDTKVQATAADLLGLEVQGYRALGAFEEIPKRAEVITLALAIATVEAYMDKTSWRNSSSMVRAYLAQLIAWDYEASEVEAETATQD